MNDYVVYAVKEDGSTLVEGLTYYVGSAEEAEKMAKQDYPHWIIITSELYNIARAASEKQGFALDSYTWRGNRARFLTGTSAAEKWEVPKVVGPRKPTPAYPPEAHRTVAFDPITAWNATRIAAGDPSVSISTGVHTNTKSEAP